LILLILLILFVLAYIELQVSNHNAFALDLVTYICCGLSIAALFITLIIFYSIE
jgi:hypothetical protein